MKTFTKALLIAAFAASPLSAKPAPAKLIIDDTDFEDVFLVAASDTKVRFQRSEFGQSTEDMEREFIQSIYFIEPDEFAAAKRTFDLGDYETALKQMQAVKREYRTLNNLPGNYSSLAGFYEMECLRNLGRLTELKEARLNFDPTGLTRQYQREQIDLYRLWEQMADESWRSLANTAPDLALSTRVSGLRAQYGYLGGMGMMNASQPIKALNSFAIAMTADGGASKKIARESAIQSLEILLADESTTFAREQEAAGAEDYNPQSVGALRNVQAGAVITVYENSFGIGYPLPEKFEVFRKYVQGVE